MEEDRATLRLERIRSHLGAAGGGGGGGGDEGGRASEADDATAILAAAASTSPSPSPRAPVASEAPRSAKSSPAGVVGGELARERARASFPEPELAALLHGSAARLRLKEELVAQMARDPVLSRNWVRFDLPRTEERKLTARAATRMIEFLRSDGEDDLRRLVRDRLFAAAFPGAHGRLSNHRDLFEPALRVLASPEQFREWGPRARDFGMLGCFAMTELGHGSFVRGLETTASFLPGEGPAGEGVFDIHSPNESAAKCWIGSASQSATHALVFAQLRVGDAAHGLHAFLVPLRDLRTGALRPGVSILDLGPKMGRNGLDNGLLLFSHVRVPRSHMLARFARVHPDGTVEASPLQQLAYGALVGGRIMMVDGSHGMLGLALTIAVRYAAVRRQFPDPAAKPRKSPASETAETMEATEVATRPTGCIEPADDPVPPTGSGERALLDFPLHQRRLLPWIGVALAFRATGIRLWELHATVMHQLGLAPALASRGVAGIAGGVGELPASSSSSSASSSSSSSSASTSSGVEESGGGLGGSSELPSAEALENLKRLHALSAGMKAEATWIALDGVDACRQACGGHGYSAFSGLPALVADFAVMVSWEGDNHVMALQTARFLLSGAQRCARDPKTATGPLSFLASYDPKRRPFRDTTSLMVASAAAKASPSMSWDECLHALRWAAAHVVFEAAKEVDRTAAPPFAPKAKTASGTSTPGPTHRRPTADAVAAAVDANARTLVACVRMFSRFFIAESFGLWLERVRPVTSAATMEVLDRLALAAALSLLERSWADLAGHVLPEDIRRVGLSLDAVSSALRPDAVALVDAWRHSDWVLGQSTLGARDGRVYERYIAALRAIPGNGETPAYWAETFGAALRAARV